MYVWYSTNSMYGTVPTVCMVQYQQYVWYSTNNGVIQTLNIRMNQAKHPCVKMPL